MFVVYHNRRSLITIKILDGATVTKISKKSLLFNPEIAVIIIKILKENARTVLFYLDIAIQGRALRNLASHIFDRRLNIERVIIKRSVK